MTTLAFHSLNKIRSTLHAITWKRARVTSVNQAPGAYIVVTKTNRSNRFGNIATTVELLAVPSTKFNNMSLQNLPPPVYNDIRNDSNDDDDDDDTVSSWDSMYQRQPVERNIIQQNHQLCSHAVSVGHCVFGINNNISYDLNTTIDNRFYNVGSTNNWWTWQRSCFEVSTSLSSSASTTGSSSSTNDGSFNALSSNRSGTVIAVATDTGVVSLLRGCDGQILATRRVGSRQSMKHAIRLTWISVPERQNGDTDMLLIDVPPIDNDNSNSNGQLILVTNVNGTRLNHSDSTIVAGAIRNTQVMSINMDTTVKYDLRAITASQSSSNDVSIRLVACDDNSQLVIFDFDLITQDLKLVQDSISLQTSSSSPPSTLESKLGYTIDFELGFYQQATPNDSFVVCSAFVDPTAPMIVWFHPMLTQTVCLFTIPQLKVQKPTTSKLKKEVISSIRTTSKIIAMGAISSWNNNEAMAMAVAVKSTQKSGIATISSMSHIYVVQSLLEGPFGLKSECCAHVVYVIPVEECVMSIQLASFGTDENIPPYAFRYLSFGTDTKTNPHGTYTAFQPDRILGPSMGKMRTIIHRKDFNEAEKIIGKIGLMSLTMEPYANFHPSEVVVHRLQHKMRHMMTTNIDDINTKSALNEEIQLCLRQLTNGVVLNTGDDSNTLGFDLFVEAIEFLTANTTPTNISLQAFHHYLLDIVAAIQNVLPSMVNSEQVVQLESHRRTILERVSALDFLSSSRSQHNMPVQCYNIRSLCHLYEICIQQRRFVMAENVFRSSRGNPLWSISALVKPLLTYITGADVAPIEYVFLLQDVVFPNLVVNDRMLSLLKSWSCRISDTLDENHTTNRDLNAALLLLTTMDAGIRKLQLQIHGSFASYSPFTARYIEARHRRPSPKTNVSTEHFSDVHKSTFSFAAQQPPKVEHNVEGSISCRDERIPTILERSALQRGLTSSSSTRAESYDSGDDDSVQLKLLHVQCLQEVRSFGLGHDVVSLQHFISYGGSKRIGKDLVRLLSSTAKTDEDRSQLLKEKFQPFCQRYFVDCDNALYECVIDICRDKIVAVQAIEECCSISRCCLSATIRCDITLVILRAALFCGCTCTSLLALSKEAINVWAGADAILQSELEEALRLLQIDDIILRYCGSCARELFRVSNPRHAVNLLEFVTQHVECETVVDDTLSLCDAFNNLCPFQATKRIVENSILHNVPDLCIQLFEMLIKKNLVYAGEALVHAITYAEVILAECSNSIRLEFQSGRQDVYKERALLVCDRILGLIHCALKFSVNIASVAMLQICYTPNDWSLSNLLSIFMRIQKLQNEYSVYISTAEMFQPIEITNKILPFLVDVTHSYSVNDLSLVKNKLSVASRVCSLLSMLSEEEKSDIWMITATIAAVKMVNEGGYLSVLQFLSDIGLRSQVGSRIDAQCHVCVSRVLCGSKQRDSYNTANDAHRLLYASALLRNWSLTTLNAKDLSTILELSVHFDVACQVLSRCDEGVGESVDCLRYKLQCQTWQEKISSNCDKLKDFDTPIHKPDIHPSWYTGDGILLPPAESLRKVTLFLNGQMRKNKFTHDGANELYDLLIFCGAHSLALRILCESASVSASILHQHQSDGLLASIEDSFEETMHALLDRSLGGTGSGITSSKIDSQQAAIFLLSLPPKQAFVAYRSCIPTAMKTHNFDRLYILSNVGMIVSNDNLVDCTGSIFAVGWNKQSKFFAQCHQLATKARWWNILQFYGAQFDLNLFGMHNIASIVDLSVECEGNYAASVLPSIITSASKLLDGSQLLCLALRYSDVFNVPPYIVANEIIDYTLRHAENFSGYPDCANLVADALRRPLDCLNPLSRCKCLRRCLINIESSVSYQKEYELLNVLLSLYHESLVSNMENDQAIHRVFLETELENIERRRDVLAILTAFFQGDRLAARPKFSGFFQPLPEAFGYSSTNQYCGILGKTSPESTKEFDPLEALEHLLSSMQHESGVVTALAPLCCPLLLPQGYIHARSLMARFKHAREGEIEFPSFENDLTPVLNKLVSPTDRAALAEWCTNQYNRYDSYKLNCLSSFLDATIAASTEIEHRRRHFPNDKILKQQERDFLEKIKLITSAKSTLSDLLQAKLTLRSLTTSVPKAVEQLVNSLIVEIDKTIQASPASTPEAMIDFLLTIGSRLASEITLHGIISFPIGYFRQYCSIIHSASYSIANQYSHIDVTEHARRLAHRWLFYGDSSTSIGTPRISPLTDRNPLQVLDIIDEESTFSFVLDLSVMNSTESDVCSNPVKDKDGNCTISLEEISSLHSCSSREFSEEYSQRSALRIAFVLAFSLPKQTPTSDDSHLKENTDINRPRLANSCSKRSGLLAQVKTKREFRDDNNLFDLGLELLRIVFAKPGTSSNFLHKLRLNVSISDAAGSATEIPSTITFAMRHRALRVAAILCPQEVLEEIVRNEGILSSSNNIDHLSLCQCSFGAFLVKEIEEMGLPLPHSELLQLSSMHFLSYARSLWRDHRDDAILEKSKGRFYLLLIELSLQNDHTDPSFLSQLLNELVRWNLPRSLLRALEHIVDYKARDDVSSPSSQIGSVTKAIATVSDAIISDLSRGMKTDGDNLFSQHQSAIISTVGRLNAIIVSLLDSELAIAQFNVFVDVLSTAGDEPTLRKVLALTTQSRERAERYIIGASIEAK